MSRQEAISEYHQYLIIVYKKALIQLINYLTNHGLPPINNIVKNLAKEIIRRSVNKN